jgi:hypothetical protein
MVTDSVLERVFEVVDELLDTRPECVRIHLQVVTRRASLATLWPDAKTFLEFDWPSGSTTGAPRFPLGLDGSARQWRDVGPERRRNDLRDGRNSVRSTIGGAGRVPLSP